MKEQLEKRSVQNYVTTAFVVLSMGVRQYLKRLELPELPEKSFELSESYLELSFWKVNLFKSMFMTVILFLSREYWLVGLFLLMMSLYSLTLHFGFNRYLLSFILLLNSMILYSQTVTGRVVFHIAAVMPVLLSILLLLQGGSFGDFGTASSDTDNDRAKEYPKLKFFSSFAVCLVIIYFVSV